MSSPAATNGEEPVVKKKKKIKQSQIPSLPDDVLVSCLARVSRLHYPILSLVSKNFRSLIASPELYKTRSLLGRTESCLYVCLGFPPDPYNQRWFTLCMKPNRTVANKKPSCNILVPIPTSNSPPTQWLNLVSVGSNIYTVGGSFVNGLSSRVSILDCQTHTWREAPSMRLERYNPSANVVDGKIYVAGGCKDLESSNWMEVFDPKTQTWEPVLAPLKRRFKNYIHKSLVMKGVIYFGGDKGLVYKPREGKWFGVSLLKDLQRVGVSYCVIGNVLYLYGSGNRIRWYDSKLYNWMNLKGMEGLPNFAFCGFVRLVDYGRKMAILWSEFLLSDSGCDDKIMIWCAVIALERRNSEEMWGKVEWTDEVLTVPVACEFVCALSTIV
ncbi:F-box-like domain superfamily [Arabidopsis thaliana x Arabidopsis arenosa]|uniref:F-box-like domain superfamily n=1 Tax=Arabidopsis thaliana x Arabidopsis arenosa TaxID=1240361 RepID=A0A8T1Z484_9BRAS|nr:F-box-like domain superfamily [Arabidopsis thaliana x Arabidopsis arenosa]